MKSVLGKAHAASLLTVLAAADIPSAHAGFTIYNETEKPARTPSFRIFNVGE